MKSIRVLFVLLVYGLLLTAVPRVQAQCAMCTAAVESNHKAGDHATHGLNNGILYLLSAPYLAVAALGVLWYKRYRRKNVDLDIPREKIHLN